MKKMKKNELKAELKARNLRTDGQKKVLLERLLNAEVVKDVLAYILVECVNDRGKLSIPSIINWHLEYMLFSLKGKP